MCYAMYNKTKLVNQNLDRRYVSNDISDVTLLNSTQYVCLLCERFGYAIFFNVIPFVRIP